MKIVYCLFREVSLDGYNRDGKEIVALYERLEDASRAANSANGQYFAPHHFVEQWDVRGAR